MVNPTGPEGRHDGNLLAALLFDEETLKGLLDELAASSAASAEAAVLQKLLGRHLFLMDGYWVWLCREVLPPSTPSGSNGGGGFGGGGGGFRGGGGSFGGGGASGGW